jgi:hypothetical protein
MSAAVRLCLIVGLVLMAIAGGWLPSDWRPQLGMVLLGAAVLALIGLVLTALVSDDMRGYAHRLWLAYPRASVLAAGALGAVILGTGFWLYARRPVVPNPGVRHSIDVTISARNRMNRVSAPNMAGGDSKLSVCMVQGVMIVNHGDKPLELAAVFSFPLREPANDYERIGANSYIELGWRDALPGALQFLGNPIRVEPHSTVRGTLATLLLGGEWERVGPNFQNVLNDERGLVVRLLFGDVVSESDSMVVTLPGRYSTRSGYQQLSG